MDPYLLMRLLSILLVSFFVVPLYGFSQGGLEGIDAIYVINLGRRQDRLAATTTELAKYGLSFQRFAAIDGKTVPLTTLLKLGLPYSSEMISHRWARTPSKQGSLEYEFLRSALEKKPVFSEWMSVGAIGCALSHLSVLKEAYEKGWETIWVLEDDICVEQDPHILAQRIAELDTLTERAWDILYTDPDAFGNQSQPPENFWWMWRPDLASFTMSNFAERKALGKNFIGVGSRDRTHSMIIRRSGMKKILDHIENHHLYLPIDVEIAFVSDIHLFMTSSPIVTYRTGDSDIQEGNPSVIYGTSNWESYKKSQLVHLPKFPGWCHETKANHLMDFVYKHKPEVCVEIGTFGGSTTFPLLLALQYLHKGHVFTIDAWNNQEAVLRLSPADPHFSWWKEVNLAQIKKGFLKQLKKLKMRELCTSLSMTSLQAASQFQNGSIDLLYIDGNFSKEGSLEDVTTYFPKVKKGGFIWLNEAHSPEKLASVAFLQEHAVFLREESLKNACIVFQK